MAKRTDFSARMKGRDAMHRARIPETHPTHACSEHFRRLASRRIARLPFPLRRNGTCAPFLERALGALRSFPC